MLLDQLFTLTENTRFDEPLTGYHIVYRKSNNPVANTPSFETRDAAQKYLMTRMFANHQDYRVVHTADVGVTETSDYSRRREREEAIISGKKPARKRQPAQTSDYARRREQEKNKEQGVAEADKLQGTPVVSLRDFGDKDYTKDKYGRTVPKKLKKDDPRVKFYKEPKKQGVAEGFPHDVDHMPGKTVKHTTTNCTTCHGRKVMYKLDGKLYADNKQGATKVKCPTCKGTGEKQGVEEGLRDPQDNPCWKGYHPVGTKKKNGRTVPNCVPRK